MTISTFDHTQFTLIFIPGVFLLQIFQYTCIANVIFRKKKYEKKKKYTGTYMFQLAIKRLTKIENRDHFKNININRHVKCLDN